jgi:hypothetical protein
VIRRRGGNYGVNAAFKGSMPTDRVGALAVEAASR